MWVSPRNHTDGHGRKENKVTRECGTTKYTNCTKGDWVVLVLVLVLNEVVLVLSAAVLGSMARVEVPANYANDANREG